MANSPSPIGHDGDKGTTQHDDSTYEKVDTVESLQEIDPVIDKRVTSKFDGHIIPWLFGIW